MFNANQNPEQLASEIDSLLIARGWIVQDKKSINLNVGKGVAVREYQVDIGPAYYVLFADKKLVGIIEGRRAEEVVRLTVHEDQWKDCETVNLETSVTTLCHSCMKARYRLHAFKIS